MSADKTNSKKNILLMCIVAVSVLISSCGGGGGGGVTPAPNAPQTGTGGVDGYAYAAVGSAPAARAAEAAPPAGQMPLTGARVEAECGIYTHITNTNAEGYFKISNVAAGNCELRVSKSGYATRTYPVTVAAGVTARVAGAEGAKLSPAQSGEITVTANVSGAEVTIDGVSTGLTIPETLSRVFTDISAGEHEVGVSKAGWAPAAAKNVNVTAGNNALAEFVMAPADATPPVANAGADAKTFAVTRYVYERNYEDIRDFSPYFNTYTLDGSGSYSTWGGEITYQWTQTGGAAVELRDATTARPTFVPQGNDTYVFSLVVRDAAGIYSAPDYVTIVSIKPEGKIVFTGSSDQKNYDIFTMNADGTNLRQLTDNNYYDGWPHWSPDGKRIVYTTNPSGDEATYLVATMNADGTGVATLPLEGISRDWSPDGGRILYASKQGTIRQLYEAQVDGSNPVRLTSGYEKYFAQYSKSGERILFNMSVSYDGVEIGIMNRDGSNYQRLTNEEKTHSFVGWAENERMLFTLSDCVGCVKTLYVMNADGTGEQPWPVPDGVNNPKDPVMTDDGEYILFTTTSNRRLNIMCADGSAYMEYGIGAMNISYHPGP